MNRFIRDIKGLTEHHREKLPYIGGILLLLIIYAFSKGSDKTTYVYKASGTPQFKDGKVLGFQGQSIYEEKEQIFSRSVRGIEMGQSALKETTAKLQARLDELEKQKSPSPIPSVSQSVQPVAAANGARSEDSVRVSQASENLSVSHASSDAGGLAGHSRGAFFGGSFERRGSGPKIISFPVKSTAVDDAEGIVLPPGSYVKAKVMTGVEAPEGKTNPSLLQLDYAYIGPNQHRVYLSGCFMIAKAQGDLSTERVQMQATKLSCVSKNGKMFERDVSGYIADDKDNSFAVVGTVNSKQDRVAAMAFLSSIVDGIGKAVQQTQTTSQVTPLGGSQSVMTGNGAEYLAAGGASSAASQVTQWYLQQAQNLLPTINIGSGRDVWIIMLDTVKLPTEYFKKTPKGESHEDESSHLSSMLD
jgi:hypothetical protein